MDDAYANLNWGPVAVGRLANNTNAVQPVVSPIEDAIDIEVASPPSSPVAMEVAETVPVAVAKTVPVPKKRGRPSNTNKSNVPNTRSQNKRKRTY